MPNVSAVIITFNEEHNIERCLEGLRFVDEIVIVDSGSTDNTEEIARRYTDKFIHREWPGYSSQKNYAIEQAEGPWILSLDADEVITPELAGEIESLLSHEPDHCAYTFPRACSIMGRWVRHGNWYPDRKIRLFLKQRGRFNVREVHESVQVDGTVGHLANEILHYSYPTLEEFLRKLNHYTTLDAQARARAGERVGLLELAVAPVLVFVKSFVIKRGFLDGVPGFAVAVLSGFYVFMKKLKLLERRWRQESSFEE